MKVIDGETLRQLIVGGAKNLENNKAMVDSLNVFPVPDGDTGTNMSLTMSSAVKEVAAVTSNDLDDIFKAYARGALKGARGNSGVILSQIIKGLSKVVIDCKQLTTKVFAKAMASATEVAYSAVTKPKEGTILTVIRQQRAAAVHAEGLRRYRAGVPAAASRRPAAAQLLYPLAGQGNSFLCPLRHREIHPG